MEADFSMPAQNVVRILDDVVKRRGKPSIIGVDNGPEYLSHTFADWCNKHGIAIQYIQPGKPMQNDFIERLNRLFRKDILDAYLFDDLEDLRLLADQWMDDYNKYYPHSAPNGPSSLEYLKRA